MRWGMIRVGKGSPERVVECLRDLWLAPGCPLYLSCCGHSTWIDWREAEGGLMYGSQGVSVRETKLLSCSGALHPLGLTLPL